MTNAADDMIDTNDINVIETTNASKVSLAPIPGFPEFSIEETIVMSDIQQKIKKIYELYGYVPFDTRLVETDQVLNQKGIDSKELYSLNFISKGNEYVPDEKRRKLALRFDLTVPMARYIAQNKTTISYPVKRYQIQKVYRAEGHKVATGRFNEFYQSDIDVVGYNTLDIAYDSEFPAIICNILKNVFNVERFVMRISNRKLLEGLFRENGVKQVDKIKRAVRIIDDIENPFEGKNDAIKEGKKHYVLKGCAALHCHGPNGKGSGGPALNKGVFKHSDGSTYALAYIITNGIAGTKMGAYGSTLKEDEILKLIAYIRAVTKK